MKLKIVGMIPRTILAIILASALTACSSQPSANNDTGSGKAAKPSTDQQKPQAKTEVFSAFSYEGADREQKLIEGAKKEGKLTWYTSLAGPVVNAMVDKFKQKYPFIEVEVYRAENTNLVSRLNTETQARKYVTDVMETTSDSALLLRELGFLTPYFSPAANKFPEQYRVKAEGNLVWEATARVSYISFAYNKEKLPASAVPKTLEDLLKPEMKGKITLVSSSTGMRFIGGILATLGEEKGRKFLEQLSKQNVKVESISGAALMGLIAQGEVTASPTIFQNHTEQQAIKGAPVEWIPIAPVVANAGDVIVPKTAPNPHAAILFVDFILGEEGAKVFREQQYSTPADQVSFKFWLPEEGMDSSKQYLKEYDKWKDLFSKTFR